MSRIDKDDIRITVHFTCPDCGEIQVDDIDPVIDIDSFAAMQYGFGHAYPTVEDIDITLRCQCGSVHYSELKS